jgi:hypothetical protein
MFAGMLIHEAANDAITDGTEKITCRHLDRPPGRRSQPA